MASRPDQRLAESSVHEPDNLASHPFAKWWNSFSRQKMDDEPGFKLPPNRLRRKFGVFPGWIVTELALVVANDQSSKLSSGIT